MFGMQFRKHFENCHAQQHRHAACANSGAARTAKVRAAHALQLAQQQCEQRM